VNKTPADFNLAAFVKAIAPHLGTDFWQYRPPTESQASTWEKIAGPDGSSISFHLDERKGEIKVSGNFIDYAGHWYPSDCTRRVPGINIGVTRSPEQAARDIARRLLPDYLEVYKEGKDQYERRVLFDTQVSTLATAFAEQIGETRHRQGDTRVSWYVKPPEGKGGDSPVLKDRVSVEVRVNSPTSIEVNLSNLLPEMAREVLDLFEKCPREEV